MLRIAFLLVLSSVRLVHSERVCYSGLEESRITKESSHSGEVITYYYMYNIGEHLSIGCEHDASLTYYQFAKLTPAGSTELYESQFETQATRNLESSSLYCTYSDRIHDVYYYTHLDFVTCKAVVALVGPGLILDDDTIPNMNKYSYKFKEPVYIEPTCTVSGMMGDYELRLEDDNGSVAATQVVQGSIHSESSVSRRFWLTPNSRTISCTVKDLGTNSTKFTSTIDLKYEPDSTTAPSISSSTSSSHPQNQSDSERNPLDNDISHPQNQSDSERNPLDNDISHPQNQSVCDMCSEASVGQFPREGSRLCTEKLLVKALMRSALADERQAEAEMRTAVAAEKQAEAVQQGVAQGVGLLRDLMTILGRPPPALTIDRGYQV